MMLHQTNVQTVMNRDVVTIPSVLGGSEIEAIKQRAAFWYLLHREGEALYLLQGRILADHLAQLEGDHEVDLTELDLRRWSVACLGPRATLREALDTMHVQTVEAIVIEQPGRAAQRLTHGVLTRESIDQFYLSKY
jgi:hypothetical protein